MSIFHIQDSSVYLQSFYGKQFFGRGLKQDRVATLVTKPPHGNSTAISFQEIVAIQLRNCPDRFIGPFFTNKIGHWRRKTKAAKSLLFAIIRFGDSKKFSF